MVDQGTMAWRISRLGMITASRMSDVMGSYKARKRYYEDLVAERHAIADGREREYVDDHTVTAKPLRHGHEMEPRAAEAYELVTGASFTRSPPLMMHPDYIWLGASLDGTVRVDGTVEIKSPIVVSIHVNTCLFGPPHQANAQVQCQLEISGRQWCDFVSFNAEYKTHPIYIQRIFRDVDYAQAMLAKCVELNDQVVAREFPAQQSIVDREIPRLF